MKQVMPDWEAVKKRLDAKRLQSILQIQSQNDILLQIHVTPQLIALKTKANLTNQVNSVPRTYIS